MRGHQRPAVRVVHSESQLAFQALSRHRRTKLAKAAHTTLVKADQWSHGGATESATASSLEAALQAFRSKATGKR
jgi:hypothetical protein